MAAMWRLTLAILLLAACSREPEAPPPAKGATPPKLPPPKPPAIRRTLPAPLERIAFAREDGLWTIRSDGADLERIIPPTCPRASEPSWAPDRRWLAFTAELDPESNLFARNIFVARPDGSELGQVTPMARPGGTLGELPKGIVRGRAVVAGENARTPAAGLRVTSSGMSQASATDADGAFQTYLPVGGGWVKISGMVEGRSAFAWRFASCSEGRITELKDVALTFGPEDLPAAPAWSSDGTKILYVVRHSPLDRARGASRSTLRRIGRDGSGDETVATFSSSSIIAGPVVRGGSAWCKMSDGAIVRIDLKSKAAVDSWPAGICAPDALAVSPDGQTAATLAMDATGARSLLLVRREKSDAAAAFKAGEPAPRAIDFSPDGTRIVMDLHGADGRSSLWILNLATARRTALSDNGTSPTWYGR